MKKLRYTRAFDQIDPEGELQGDAEQRIAGQLFDDWTEHTLFWHAHRIIITVALDFCPQEDPTSEGYQRLIQDTYDFLLRWQEGLESPEDGPGETEAVQIGKDLTLFVLSHLKPEYVEEVEP